MAKVRFETANIEVEVEDHSSLKSVCEQHGVLFGCRSGGCGTCIVKILSGHENLNAPTEEELDFFGEDPNSERLACQLSITKGFVTIA
ncbi:2Fe-2S iron-sulfur cluster-binding protein [Candidatus Similichlamydia laticola]|uniref:Ferredoxin n=1 Tax=Candidatus Similichlamydia laticola TaxID=2170265 RepID=A0A369KFC4_9BACT|nr:2Fe-2S iron-sulfur cluster-binding protein [Candidatus Similichlamydia laticola]RDB31597.1 Ferredoxin [Candidatus Similichlamydia laticola]